MTAERVVAVVPVRGLRTGKTRLAGDLPPEAREALTRRMLRNVVLAAIDSRVVNAVAVVSPDPEALALADAVAPGSVVPLPQDPATPGLDAAVSLGRKWAQARGAGGALVLFGDLPLLTGDDVRHLVEREAPVVLAPDHHGTGTNALLLRLGDDADGALAFRFRFGPGSYARHVAEARRLGLRVKTSLGDGTAFDLDTPEDWRALIGTGRWQPGGEAVPVVAAGTGTGRAADLQPDGGDGR